MQTILLIAALAVGQAPVEVKTLSGDPRQGGLLSLSAQELVLESPGGPATIPLDEVLRISVAGAKSPVPQGQAAVWLELTDGSSLVAQSFGATGGQATIKLLSGADVSVPTRAIRWVRLKTHTGPDEAHLAQQWTDILAAPAKDDVLVIRKKTTLPAAEPEAAERSVLSLDYLGGVLYDVSEAMVKFEFDGEKIDVRREKVEGMIYYHPAGAAPPEVRCQIADVYGNRWSGKSVTCSQGQCEIVLASGVRHKEALEAIESLDYSSGKLLFLSDLKPESVEWTPFFDAAKTPSAAEFYQPRFDRALGGRPLQIGSRTFEKGVSLRSRTRISWRLPSQFRRFAATAGIDFHADDYGGKSGDVQLVVLGDDKPLIDRRIQGGDGAVELDLDLTGVRRLTVLVDYGGNIDIGDYLDLGDARVVK